MTQRSMEITIYNDIHQTMVTLERYKLGDTIHWSDIYVIQRQLCQCQAGRYGGILGKHGPQGNIQIVTRDGYVMIMPREEKEKV